MVDSGSFFHMNSGPTASNTRVMHSFAVPNLANGANSGLLKPFFATYPSPAFFQATTGNSNATSSQLPFLSSVRPQIQGSFCYQTPGAPNGSLVSIDLSPPFNSQGHLLPRGPLTPAPLCINPISGRHEPFSFYHSQQFANGPYQPSASLASSTSNNMSRSNASVKESFDSSKHNEKGRHSLVPSFQDKKKSGFSKTNLYIAGLSENVSDDMVYGLVNGIVIPKSCKALLSDGKCTGTGFIDCKTEEDAAKAKNHIEKLFKGFLAWSSTAEDNTRDIADDVPKVQCNNNHGEDENCDFQKPLEDSSASTNLEDEHTNGTECVESHVSHKNGTSQYLNLRLMTKEGKNLEVKFAYENEKDLYNIYVKNLPRDNFTEENLQNVFQKYGTVTSVKLLEGKNGSGPTGSGFVRFANTDDARRAIDSINESHIVLQSSGQAIRCKLADKSERHNARVSMKSMSNNSHHETNYLTNLSNKSSNYPIISASSVGFQATNPNVINTAVMLRPTVPLVNNPSSLPVAGGYTFHYAGPPQPTAVLSPFMPSFSGSVTAHVGQNHSINSPFLTHLNGAVNPVSVSSLPMAQGLTGQTIRSLGQPPTGSHPSQCTVPTGFCDPNVLVALQAQMQAMHIGGHVPPTSTHNTGTLFNTSLLHSTPALMAQPLLISGNDIATMNYANMMSAASLFPVGVSSQSSSLPATSTTNSSQQLPQPSSSSQNLSTRN